MDLSLATTPASVPTRPVLYRCCADWEHSQHDDSDWYCVAYDAVNDKLVRVETGTTRFADALRHGGGVVPMTDEMRPRAKAVLVRIYEQSITHAERMRVEEPRIGDLVRGTEVRLITDHRYMSKEKATTTEPCGNCGGTGQWTNIRNQADKRPCFRCNGSGAAKVTKRTRAKGEDGKPVWAALPVGTVCEVMGQATFGQFFRNGYNQPDRSNTTVYLRMADGTEAQCPAAKLRLNCEMASAEELHERAVKASEQGESFYYPFATARSSML